MSRLALTLIAYFTLQGPLCLLHCLDLTFPAPDPPPCHAASGAGESDEGCGSRIAERGGLVEALSPAGTALDASASTALLAPVAALPRPVLAVLRPVDRPPPRRAAPRLYLSQSTLLI